MHMLKKIYGKIYDTDTAEFLAGYCNMDNRYFIDENNPCYEHDGFSDDDIEYSLMDQRLYRKSDGEYFISIDGGINTYVGILPMNEFEAKEWVREYCSIIQYIKIFGDINEW